MSLHDLPAKWRADAVKIEEISRPTDAKLRWDHGACDTMRSCASELESALAVGGEAVAWVDRYDLEAVVSGRRTHTSLYPSKADGDDIPLFTSTVGAVQVTDEDVRWLEDIHEALTESGGPTNNMRAIAVRRAINALNPGGSRE